MQGTPDLQVDAAMLASSLLIEMQDFPDGDCAITEGCVGAAGTRKLLRFAVAVPNLGTGDLILGKPQDNPALFEFSPCHNHFHFTGFARYELRDAGNSTVLLGRKQSFCIQDSQRVTPGAPTHSYNCNNQGISVGWEDIYDATIACQFLDITAVPAGNYTLVVTVNPDQTLTETDLTNNVATAPVTIP